MAREPTAARELDLQLHSMEVSSADKYEDAFKEAKRARSGALAVLSTPLASSHQSQIAEPAARNRLPAIYVQGSFGGLAGLQGHALEVPQALDGLHCGGLQLMLYSCATSEPAREPVFSISKEISTLAVGLIVVCESLRLL